MSQFRKKPVVITARQLNDKSGSGIARWITENGGTVSVGVGLGNEVSELSIKTLEGVMVANLGDWIIKGVKGEFYPCKPDIFEATYEAV